MRLSIAPSLLCLLAASCVRAQDRSTVYYFNPDWSPDGTKLVFESGVDGRLSIYSVGADGRNLTRLTDDAFNDEGPVWSPNGDRIAFYSNRRPDREDRPVSLQVYVMNVDGTGQRRLTDEGTALDYKVSWSPDGSRLVFQSRPEINPGVHSLYSIAVDGTDRQRLTDGRFDDSSPAWSPDGATILFVRAPALYSFFADQSPEERASARAGSELALLSVDDGTIRTLTHNSVRDFDPSWSADGKSIFFFQENGSRRTLVRMPLGETAAALVEDALLVSDSRVTRTRASPDGRLLAYTKEVDGRYGLFVYDLAQGREQLVVGGARDPSPM